MRRKRDRDRDNQSANKRARRFRRRYLLVGLLILLLVATLAAPIIIAKTPLRNAAAAWALRDLDGRLHIGSATLSWFSAVQLRDVRLVDAQGETLVQVDAIRSKKPLLSLIANRRQLGRFRIEAPTVTVQVRRNGTNLEDTLHALVASSGEESGAKVQAAIEVVNGRVHLRRQDDAAGEAFAIEAVQAEVLLGSDSPLTVEVQGVTRSAGGDGRFEANVRSIDGDAADGPSERSTEISLVTERLPLELMEFGLLRFGTLADIEGDLDADIKIALAPGQPSVIAVRRFDARRVSLAAHQWLQSDRLALDVFSAFGTTALSGGQLELDQCQVRCDIAQLEASGMFDLAAIAEGDLRGILPDTDFRVDGEIDVGRLAAMMPETLSVKDDTRITGGSVRVNAFSRLESDQRRWVATLGTSAVTAVSQGRPIAWDQPLQITLSAVDSPQGPTIETLSCESDFLNATATGTLQKGSLEARGNLSRLAEQLGRFVDLSQLQLAGELQATIGWQSPQPGRIHCACDVELAKFALSTPSSDAWQEERLTIQGDVLLAIEGDAAQPLQRGQLTLKAGADYLEMHLAELPEPQPENLRPVKVMLRGQLDTWLPRIKPWVSLPQVQTSGRVDLAANGTMKGSLLRVDKADLRLEDFRYEGGGIRVAERQVIVQANGHWDFDRSQLGVKQATLTSSTVALSLEQATMQLGQAPRLAGQLSYRCDLARLLAWFAAPSAAPANTRFAGHVTGDADVRLQDRRLDATVSADLHQFEVLKRAAASNQISPVALEATAWQPLWQDNLVDIDARCHFDMARAVLSFEEATVAGEGYAVRATGSLSDLADSMTADISGRVDYDLSAITKRLQGQLGQNVQISGRDRGTFRLRGPLREPSQEATASAASPVAGGLVSKQLTGEAQLGWTAANLYGFTIGEGELSAQLREGVVDFKPIQAPVGDGRINVTPRLYLNNDPATLVIGRGTVAENIAITPAMSRGWLKFVAPMVANATEAQGRFSVDLAGAQVPLSAPAQGNIRGTLQVHHATFGPGKMGRELLIPAARIQALIRGQAVNSLTDSQLTKWLQLPQQQVAFHLVDGRVHHENFHLTAGSIGVVTSGNVGMDQSVDMVARIAIDENLVGQSQLLAPLKGQTLQVPIKGTLGRPLSDSRAVGNLTRQLIRGATERTVEREVQRGIERGLQQLFGPPRGAQP